MMSNDQWNVTMIEDLRRRILELEASRRFLMMKLAEVVVAVVEMYDSNAFGPYLASLTPLKRAVEACRRELELERKNNPLTN